MKRIVLFLSSSYLLAALGVLVGWWFAQVSISVPLLVYAAFVVSLSPVSFIAYALDKRTATRNHWRTPEKTLHMIDVLGGWPGGAIAQQVLRHKSQKRSFRIVLGLTMLLHVVLLMTMIYLSTTRT